ncbi:MAG: transposase, partial [Vicinamibacteria bacterium]|nr:transposase [Vicinamibacteria bacterium]
MAAEAIAQTRRLADRLGRPGPRTLACLEAGFGAATQFFASPKTHWSRIHSTNGVERLHGEIKRRTKAVHSYRPWWHEPRPWRGPWRLPSVARLTARPPAPRSVRLLDGSPGCVLLAQDPTVPQQAGYRRVERPGDVWAAALPAEQRGKRRDGGATVRRRRGPGPREPRRL